MDVEKKPMFDAIFNQVPLPVTVLQPNSPQFTIVAMNNLRRNAPGTPTDAVGRDAFDVYKPWDKNSEEQINLLINGLNEVIKNKAPLKIPLLYFEIPLANGAIVHRAWVQNEISPVLDEQGNVTYLLSITSDVTDIELNRRALQEAKEKEQLLMEELAVTNQELKSTNEGLITLNEELAATNEELAVTNEELEATNDQLLAVNADLAQSRRSLERFNIELEDRVAARTTA
jgi:dimeric dUTPase (all-alpha-NTP-PPase superfamily)